MSDKSSKMFSTSRSWFSPENLPALHVDEVHVWRVSLDISCFTVKKLRELLASEEAATADRFHFEADSRHFVVARACLRKLLGGYLVIDPNEVHFSYSEYGKPSLAKSINERQLSFNLAHSGSMALYALTLKRRIGIDLEYVRSAVPDYQIARKYFSPSEVERLEQLPRSSLRRGFFNCWTRKEALVKAIGTGLSLPLNQFDVTLAPDEPAALLRTHWNTEDAARWSLTDLDAGPDYVAAVAVEGHDWRLSTWHLDEPGLL
jgi:4'-phosphopantetheinyl transferase